MLTQIQAYASKKKKINQISRYGAECLNAVRHGERIPSEEIPTG